MKNSLKIVLCVLVMCGVFGADEDKVKTVSVSVTEGDSVTLNPLDLAQIQGFVKIQWKFGGTVIARTYRTEILYPNNERFRGRLQLNSQTGSLTITNIKITYSGFYELQIDYSDTKPSNINFIVTVNESPPVDAYKFEMKNESVMEGDPVTLQTGVIKSHGDELIVWRFGDKGQLLAKSDKEAKSPSFYDTDKRFKERLQLNDQTGSLIITNTRKTDSGLYTVKISSNKQTLYKTFTVIVSAVPEPGLSPGAVAGIVVVVLLVAGAAAAGGVFYYRCNITNLPGQKWSVPTEDKVTLNPDTEIQTGDEIQWLFGAEDTLIAEIKKETGEMTTYDGPGEIFKDKLKLDETTGSLTIECINIEHTGLYTLKIRRGRKTLNKRFQVSLNELSTSEMEGEDVTVEPDIIMQTNDEIQWLFGDEEQQTVIAEIKSGEMTKCDGPESWRFRDRLELGKETGSLTITKFTSAHTGFYILKIRRDRETLYIRFLIFCKNRKIEVMEEETVTLKSITEINKDDLILWMFRDAEMTAIAMFRGETGKIFTYDHVAGGRFKDRLELDKTKGSLTIKNTRTAHSGHYKLQIISSSGVLSQTFIVTVEGKVEEKLVNERDSVTLNPNTEIHGDDQIHWMFGDEDNLIAQIREGTREIYEARNERFRDRLKLDKTGSLTITNISTELTGLYKLQIRSSRGTLYKKFWVFIKYKVEEKSVNEGDSVTLKTDTEIREDDLVLWMFGDENNLIAQIRGGTVETYDEAKKRFSYRLKLDNTTGSLTISNISYEHAGLYKLQIISSSRGTLYKKFKVSVQLEEKLVNEGDSVTLNPNTEIQRDDQIQWMFGDENNLIAQIRGGTGETNDGANERFKDRLKLDKMNGSLSITNISTELTGLYKLKIINSRVILYKKFTVSIQYKVEEKSVNEGDSVTLNPNTEIQRDDQILWMFRQEKKLIAQIRGGTGETYDGDRKRFKNKLKLDNTTGSLTISNISSKHTGLYELQIISSSRGTLYKKFKVSVQPREKSVMNENNDSTGKQGNQSATVVMPLLDGVNDEEGMSSL